MIIVHWILLGVLPFVISWPADPAEQGNPAEEVTPPADEPQAPTEEPQAPTEEPQGVEQPGGEGSPDERTPEGTGDGVAAESEQRVRMFFELARALLDDEGLRERLKGALRGPEGEEARATVDRLTALESEAVEETAPAPPDSPPEPQLDVPEDMVEEYGSLIAKESELVDRFQQADGPDEKESVLEELRTALDRLFEIREGARAREIERLSKQLDRLTDRLQKRQEKRQEIVQRRIGQLLGIGDDLDW